MKSTASLEVLCLIMLSGLFFSALQLITSSRLPIWGFNGIPVCVCTSVSVSICVSCAFSLAYFLVWLLFHVLICFLFILFYYYFLDTSLFSNRNPKCVGLDGKGDGTVRSKGGETVARIYCMKETIFNKRKKNK